MDKQSFFNFLFLIGSLAAVVSFFVLMPMFFTYLSEGDVRAPSQIVPEMHQKR